jgi:glycosyltransferase involved in cell wall biosynthesis
VARRSAPGKRPLLAILPWGNVIEDFLETIGLSLDEFCGDFAGSWMFGYVEALRHAGVDSMVICCSSQVRRVERRRHGTTGATITLLPAALPYRLLEPRLVNPYGRSVRDVFGRVPRHLRPALVPLRELILYLPTPPVRLARELRGAGCDAVLCQEYEFPRFDVTAAVGVATGVPVYAVFQGGNYQRSRLERLTRPAALRAARGLIVPTETELERLRARYGIDGARIACIPNPVNTDRWRPRDRAAARDELGIARDARVIGWHGRVSLHKKGLDVFVEAWAELLRRRPGSDTRLLLVGTGHDAVALRRLLAAVPGKAHWVDRFISDGAEVAAILSAADVYAFPSRLEGFAVALIEAMACALPVVAADASGVRDALGGAGAGTIVPADDAPALAAELERVLDDPAGAAMLGRSARAHAVRLFSPERVGAQLRSVLFPG